MRGLLIIVVALSLIGSVAGAKKKKEDEMPGMNKDWEEQMRQRREAHAAEMKHYNSIPNDKVSDWTIHKDVDDSMYWFSRSLKRSTREPPKGWTKDKSGNWVAPPRNRDEL
jgi:hypothetical protein